MLNLPTRRQESWKYTDLSFLSRQLETPSSATQPALASDALNSALPCDAPRLVFANGHLQQALCTVEDNILASLQACEPWAAEDDLQVCHQQHQQASYELKLNASAPAALQIIFINQNEEQQVASYGLRVVLDAHAKTHLIEQQLGGGGLSCQRMQFQLAEGAQLDYTRIQAMADNGHLLSYQDSQLGRNASLRQIHLDIGGRLSRLHSQVALQAPEASMEYYAAAALKGKQLCDHHVEALHQSPHCRSRLQARGIASERSRQVFNGRIVVARGAQKTDSEQLLRNLLIGDQAEVDAKPELEIYADDVKCAHGSTVGRLDKNALFYLRSRGVSEDEARRLLIQSFAQDVLKEVSDEALQQNMRNHFSQHLSLA